MQKFHFTIKAIDSDEVNAFALLRRIFYVNKGLILAADTNWTRWRNGTRNRTTLPHATPWKSGEKRQQSITGMLAGIILVEELSAQFAECRRIIGALGMLKFSRCWRRSR